MASTFSPSLRLELIGDGDQSGIWGQTTNNNLGALIEQAIAGVITVNIADANYALTNFNGVTDEARNAVITITGSLSAQRNIVVPLADKVFTFRNATTGGFNLKIVGDSGPQVGVIIPNGVVASVYCDGTDVFPLNTGATGNYSVNGNLRVTGTTTLTGALTASTAAFSGAISSVSPTFTGTPTAPTATIGNNTTQIANTAFVQASTAALGLGTMSTQNANAVAITGGSINGTTIGATTASTVRGTTGTFTGAVSGTTGTFSGAVSGTTGTFSGAVSGTTITASTQFTGPGTGLTGTAASLSIGGSAATATTATNATTVTTTVASGATGTTQSPGTNNTTLATTAFVQAGLTAGAAKITNSGGWSVTPTGTKLFFNYNGTDVGSLDSSGNFIVSGNVTAFGTP